LRGNDVLRVAFVRNAPLPNPQSPMFTTQPSHPSRYLDRVDPRLRIVAAVALSVLVTAAGRPAVPLAVLAAASVGLAFSSLGAATVLGRLAPLNVMMLVLAAVLPLTTAGEPLARLGPIEPSREGLALAGMVALKGNAVVLTLLLLVGTMEAATLGHALAHLRVPEKLVHLLLFTVRYLDVIHREYLRLRAAMRVRGFRPRMDRHTYRTLGYLVGMLLVRSHDRAQRVAAAMKCRAFRGRFYLLDHFAVGPRDLPFALAALSLLTALALWEWM
jgi:cobalt/nickel transport system permease protein